MYREDVENFICDISVWSKKNFGDQDDRNPLLGMVEELGELAEILLKEDKTNTYLTREANDAIADHFIFFCDFMGRAGIKSCGTGILEIDGTYRDTDIPFRKIGTDQDLFVECLKSQGILCRLILKREQKIREGAPRVRRRYRKLLENACSAHMLNLWCLCHQRHVSLRSIVGSTWIKVKRRNWKANPTTGANNGG